MDVSANHLSRFLEAQQGTYHLALAQIKNGKKTGHWMWFIFPQLKGLGRSETARFYGINDKEEASLYLKHPILGTRLIEISQELLNLPVSDAISVFGQVDSLKLRSSMTLFSLVENASPVFTQVLARFYSSKPDEETIRILN